MGKCDWERMTEKRRIGNNESQKKSIKVNERELIIKNERKSTNEKCNDRKSTRKKIENAWMRMNKRYRMGEKNEWERMNKKN